MEIFGIPSQALFGQLLIGLINGSFYALLSLGLAVIFGLLNIINFTHGAQYMLGAFCAYLLLEWLGVGYWWSLLIAPVLVGITGVIIERTMLAKLYKLDHLYGLLLTFGLALIIQGVFRNEFGSSGLPYRIPESLQGGTNLGFMFLPNYRGWVIVASLIVCHKARRLPARGHREPTAGAVLRNQCAENDHPHLWVRRGPGCLCRRNGRTDLPGKSSYGC
jgi:branched-chain amino acid transport system permease protein